MLKQKALLLLHKALLWLYEKLVFLQARRVSELRIMAIKVAASECRVELDFPLFGDDKEFETEYWRLIQGFFSGSFDAGPITYKSLEKLESWLEENASYHRSMVLRCNAWFAKKLEKSKELEKIKEEHLALIGTELEPLTDSFFQDRKSLKRRLKKARREHRLNKYNKLTIDLAGLTSALPLVTAMFTVSGFFYCQLYYRHFGIQVSELFTLTDYLSSSIEQISVILFSMVALGGGVAYKHVTLPAESRAETEALEKGRRLVDILLIPNVLLLAFVFYQFAPQAFFKLLPLFVIVANMYFLPRFTRRYFSDPFSAFIVISFTLIFVASIFGYSRAAILGVETGEGQDFDIKTTSHVFSKSGGTLFIGGNSRYVFLLDLRADLVRIVPKDKIIQITLHHDIEGESILPWPRLRWWLKDRREE